MDNYLLLGVITPTDQPDVNVWLGHAKTYVDTVLGPRCDTILSEVPIAVNWITGEVEILMGVKDRKYPFKKGWQYGTADLVCILKDGSLLIIDWKTGGNDGAEEQLLSLGVAFQKAMPKLQYVRPLRTLCLQVNDEGMWPHEKDWTPQQIESHWDSVRFKWEDLEKHNDPVPGIHCTTLYCPHLAYCPAIQASVFGLAEADQEGAKLVSANDLVRAHRVTDNPVSNDEAGFTAAMLSAAKRQIKYTESKLKEYVNKGGAATQGGYTWGEGGNGWRWRKS
jgi:hypothetical protein